MITGALLSGLHFRKAVALLDNLKQGIVGADLLSTVVSQAGKR